MANFHFTIGATNTAGTQFTIATDSGTSLTVTDPVSILGAIGVLDGSSNFYTPDSVSASGTSFIVNFVTPFTPDLAPFVFLYGGEGTGYLINGTSDEPVNTASGGGSDDDIAVTNNIAWPCTVYDNFNRADSSTTMGTTSTGQSWTEFGTWGISSNRGYVAATGSTTIAYINAGSGFDDCELSVTLGVANGDFQMYARMQAANPINDRYSLLSLFGTSQLYKVVGFSATAISSGVSYTPANGDVIKFRLIGSSLSWYVNGVLKEAVTDTTFSSGTRVGLGVFSGTNVRYDNLCVTTATAPSNKGAFFAFMD